MVRVVLRDTNFDGYIIPNNTIVIVHLRSAMMDPEFWNSTEKKQPDRFDNNGSVRGFPMVPLVILQMVPLIANGTIGLTMVPLALSLVPMVLTMVTMVERYWYTIGTIGKP